MGKKLYKQSLKQSVKSLAEMLIAEKKIITVAESCTGGMLAQQFTRLSGSSAWFEYGFVTYSNEAKTNLLGVERQTLADYGAVSEAVSAEMAKGALARSGADVALSVTGIAGPSGGVPGKPVGTVCITAVRSKAGKENEVTVMTETFFFKGNRAEIRLQSALKAVEKALHIAALPV